MDTYNAIALQGVSIPLEYQSLQKPGNSNTEERKHILTKALAYLDAGSCCLVADRECRCHCVAR